MNSPLRIGILSTANIAHPFCDGLAGSSTVQVVAVGSRSAAAAAAFAQRHGIARVHGSYEALLADPDVDAIYNPLPNSLHAPWSERAMRAGKHVLCEKPLTVTLAEAQALFAVARETGRVLLEAYPYRYQPQTLRMQQLIAEGAIGEVRAVQAFFGITLPPGPNIRLDAALGGGAALDLGCYAVSLARLAVGRRPLRLSAQARYTEGGVDLGLTGTIHYEGGAVAQVGCAMDTAVHRAATIVGSAGLIETDYQNHTGPQRPCYLRLRRGTSWDVATEPVPFDTGDGFRFEAEHFAGLVRGSAAAGEDTLLTLQNMVTLEALLLSARQGGAEVAVQAG